MGVSCPVRLEYQFPVHSCDFWLSVAWTHTCGPVQMPYRLWNTLRPVFCRTVWGKYRACRTHTYGPLSDHTWLSKSPKSSEAHLWKLYMLIFQPRAIRPRTGLKTCEKLYKTAGWSSTSLIRVFAMHLIGKQGQKHNRDKEITLEIKIWITRYYVRDEKAKTK